MDRPGENPDNFVSPTSTVNRSSAKLATRVPVVFSLFREHHVRIISGEIE